MLKQESTAIGQRTALAYWMSRQSFSREREGALRFLYRSGQASAANSRLASQSARSARASRLEPSAFAEFALSAAYVRIGA
jgi:hypothetical protein